MRQDYEIEIQWIAFPLRPDTPQEGESLEQVLARRGAKMEEVAARQRAVAKAEGLALAERSMIYNSRLAQELSKWAEEEGRGEEFHHEAFQTYFVSGLNIGLKGVLVDLAETAGLDPAEARRVLDEREYANLVDKDWEYARKSDVVAVPTFIAGNRTIVGAQEHQVLEKLIIAAGARRRGREH